MSHEIDMSNNRANFAFTGDRKMIWHGLGSELSQDSSIESWVEEAGFNWDINHSPVSFNIGEKSNQFSGKRVLYRSDTEAPLSIVSNDYKIVQPKEILEFFRDLVGNAGMKLSTAGVLFGGKRFWALAETDKYNIINGNDPVKGNLLLCTSADGSLATQASFVSTRTVCNNTLRIALAEKSKGVRVTHSRTFDPMEIKNALGLMDEAWDTFIANVNKLASTAVSDKAARKFVYDLIARPNVAAADQPYTIGVSLDSIMNRFKTGMGNNGETLWDLLNGFTEFHQYDMGRTKLPDTKLWNNFYGQDADRKDAAFAKALEMVA